MVTSYFNALLAADVVGRLLPSSNSAQTIAQEHFSQAAILLYSLWVTRALLHRSTKVGAGSASTALSPALTSVARLSPSQGCG